MRRPLLMTSMLAALCLLAAAPARAALFPGDAIDGPSPDIRALGDLDLARDGTGGLAYVKRADGIDHVFVATFQGGAFTPAVRIDPGLAAAASQPVIGAADEGRLAIAFVSAGVVYGAVRPQGGDWSAPVPLGGGSDPAIDLSINGTAYASFTTVAGDVRVARLDRRTNTWAVIEQPVDVDPARAAGVAGARSRVAVSADGIGVVTWGEAGHVFARKMFGTALSNSPQDLTPTDFQGRVPVTSDLPDIDAEDDSSYAWVVFRQSFADGGTRILARRQRGTTFDPPVAIDAGSEPVGAPRIDLNGRGVGIGMTSGAVSGQPMWSMLKRDVFGPGVPVFAPTVAAPAAVAPAISENEAGLMAAVQGGPGEAPVVRVRTIENQKPGIERQLSRPELGPVAPELGFDAAADRASGVVVAWVQGGPADRKIVAGYLDRVPGPFAGYTSQRCCQSARPRLSWQPSFSLWGAPRYVVTVDGKPVGETTATVFTPAAPITGPTHKWQVLAVDARGQVKRMRTRGLRIDDIAPVVRTGYKRAGRVVSLAVRGHDPDRRGHRSSGMRSLAVAWGDGSRGARATSTTRLRTSHRYRRRGSFQLVVSGRDGAGNRHVVRRTVRIG
jgi:hypothetical protein